jgi:1-acyl-sn-glycerol-3-phosphate acyltransferase
VKQWLKHSVRVTVRLIWLGGELALGALNYTIRYAGLRRQSSPSARAAWLHNLTRRLLRVFQLEIQFAGDLPTGGLLVCNHLSYLDIVVLAALVPCVFVAKSEVQRWPVFGWFARMAGTVFVERERRVRAAHAVSEIEAALNAGALVVLFPEGTSSGGHTVLPFKSSLLEPAAQPSRTLTAGLLQYQLADGDASEEVCYWKDMTLLPHLLNLCGKRAVQASVHFKPWREGHADRKQLARQLHAEIVRMKQALEAHERPCQMVA